MNTMLDGSVGIGAFMEACAMTSRIGAFHDGELDSAMRREVEQHLAVCADCRAELESLRRMSGLFGSASAMEMTAEEMGRVHRLAEALVEESQSDRSLLRFVGGLLAAAASILVVCGAWWSEISPTVPAVGPVRVAVDSPAWERVAMTLRVDPEPVRGEGTALADARLADWMLDGLSGGKHHDE